VQKQQSLKKDAARADGGPDFYDHKTLLEDPPSAEVPHGRTRALGMKFALCDTTVENGCETPCKTPPRLLLAAFAQR